MVLYTDSVQLTAHILFKSTPSTLSFSLLLSCFTLPALLVLGMSSGESFGWKNKRWPFSPLSAAAIPSLKFDFAPVSFFTHIHYRLSLSFFFLFFFPAVFCSSVAVSSPQKEQFFLLRTVL